MKVSSARGPYHRLSIIDRKVSAGVSPRFRRSFLSIRLAFACILAVMSISAIIHSSFRSALENGSEETLLSASQSSEASANKWEPNTDAKILCDMIFNLTSRRLTSVPVPAEVQRAKAKPVLDALDQTWENFKFKQKGLCHNENGLGQIKSLAEAVKKLGTTCDGKDGDAIPYTLIRRMAWSLLTVLHESDCQRSILPDLIGTFSETFSSTLNCSRQSRGILELLHISKSGGTSVCQLAKAQGLYNPYATLDKNCLVQNLDLDPKWTRRQEGEDPNRFWPSVECPRWAEQSEVTCASRKATVMRNRIEFFSAEGPLHMSTTGRRAEEAGSAGPCLDVESLIVLRDPIDRARSHIAEVHRVFSKLQRYKRGPLFQLGGDLEAWSHWAPAVLDNYVTRTLLGRAFHACRDVGSLNASHLDAALLTLVSIDQITVIGEDSLNDVIFQGALGWSNTLKSKRWRWAIGQDLSALGFTSDTLRIIKNHNQLDQQVASLGRQLLQLDASFFLAAAVKHRKAANEPEGSCDPPPVAKESRDASSSGGNSSALGNISHAQALQLATSSMRSHMRYNYILKEVPGGDGRKTYIRQYTSPVTTDQNQLSKFPPGVNVKLLSGYLNLDNNRAKAGRSFLAKFPFNLHKGGCIRLTAPLYIDIRKKFQNRSIEWEPDLGHKLADPLLAQQFPQAPQAQLAHAQFTQVQLTQTQLTRAQLREEADRINRRFESLVSTGSPSINNPHPLGSMKRS